MKRLCLFVTILCCTLPFYAQDVRSDSIDHTISWDHYRADEYTRSLEFMAFPRFGIGLRYRKDLEKLTKEASAYFIDDQWFHNDRHEDFLYNVNDTAVFMITELFTASEIAIKGGLGYQGGMAGVSLNLMVSNRSESTLHTLTSILYEYDSLTARYLYHDREGNLTEHPEDDMYRRQGDAHRQTEILKLGASPTFEMHFRKNRFVFSILVALEFTWNIPWRLRETNTYGSFVKPPSAGFESDTRGFITLGRKF